MMNMNVEGQTFEINLRRSARAKRLRLTIYPDRSVFLTLPVRMSETAALRFAQDKASWIIGKIRRIEAEDNRAARTRPRGSYQRDKQAAYDFVRNRLQEMNSQYHFRFGRVAIKNQKTRWGSCSAKGNLNFNYKLLFLPLRLADYVIAHELCHLKEFNHSRGFWDLLSLAMPDYKERRRELKKILI